MYHVTLWGQTLTIDADKSLFSPDHPDRGTEAMASTVSLLPGQKLLDLGCGTGLVGIAAAKVLGAEKVILTDADPVAVTCAKANAERNGVPLLSVVCGDALEAVADKDFDWILSNPPYHADFSVARRFIEKGFNRLKVGGRLVMVVKRELWYRNKLTAIFGGVSMQEIDGYFVFTAEKRSSQYAARKEKAPKTPPKEGKKRKKQERSHAAQTKSHTDPAPDPAPLCGERSGKRAVRPQ